jgi:hypothetical protein
MEIKFLHIIFIVITIAMVLYTDEQALSWVLGRKQYLDAKRVALLHRAIALGLAALLVTGGLMYAQAAPAYLSNPTFIVKMVAIAALILNTYAISRFAPVATVRTFKELSSAQRMPLLVSGVVSFVGWAATVLAGLFLS